MEPIQTSPEVIEMYAEDVLETKRKNVIFNDYIQWLTLQELIKIRKLLEAKE